MNKPSAETEIQRRLSNRSRRAGFTQLSRPSNKQRERIKTVRNSGIRKVTPIIVLGLLSLVAVKNLNLARYIMLYISTISSSQTQQNQDEHKISEDHDDCFVYRLISNNSPNIDVTSNTALTGLNSARLSPSLPTTMPRISSHSQAILSTRTPVGSSSPPPPPTATSSAMMMRLGCLWLVVGGEGSTYVINTTTNIKWMFRGAWWRWFWFWVRSRNIIKYGSLIRRPNVLVMLPCRHSCFNVMKP